MTSQTPCAFLLTTALQGRHYPCGNNIPDGEMEAEWFSDPSGPEDTALELYLGLLGSQLPRCPSSPESRKWTVRAIPSLQGPLVTCPPQRNATVIHIPQNGPSRKQTQAHNCPGRKFSKPKA